MYTLMYTLYVYTVFINGDSLLVVFWSCLTLMVYSLVVLLCILLGLYTLHVESRGNVLLDKVLQQFGYDL